MFLVLWADMKAKGDLGLRSAETNGSLLVSSQASPDTDDLDDEDESDSSSPPLPYLQSLAPDGCCLMDGTCIPLFKPSHPLPTSQPATAHPNPQLY